MTPLFKLNLGHLYHLLPEDEKNRERERENNHKGNHSLSYGTNKTPRLWPSKCWGRHCLTVRAFSELLLCVCSVVCLCNFLPAGAPHIDRRTIGLSHRAKREPFRIAENFNSAPSNSGVHHSSLFTWCHKKAAARLTAHGFEIN